MKKILIMLLLSSTLLFGASVQDCRNAVRSQGYQITNETIVSTDSGGELAVNFGARKGNSVYSIFVEVDSSGRVIVFDVLHIY